MKNFLWGVIFFFSSAGITLASNPFDITFPIPELGGCANQQECKLYCDEPTHSEACFAFAQKHGFVSKGDAQKAEKAKEFAQKTGPGGCVGEEACRTYCKDELHIDACIRFAEREGFMTKEEAQRARKFQNQTGPGGCVGEKQCHTYCEAPGHLDECLDFAVREGFMTQEKASHIREQAKRGFTPDKPGPGGCKGEECRAYCENPDHAEECLQFAEENHLMSPEELVRAKKGLQALKKGGPGGCRGEKACHAYCESPDHSEECVNFAIENGFMLPEEAERAKKFAQQARDGGPGGCKGDQCRTYCESPEHQEECFAFAKKHGLATEEEQRRFEAGQKLDKHVKEMGGPGGCRDEQSCRDYCSEPVHAEECITFAAIKGGVSPDEARRMLDEFRRHSGGGPMMQGEFRSEQGRPPEEFRREFGRQGSYPSWQGGPPPAFPEGPGGCKSPEECITYCSDPQHRDTCAKFGPSADGMPPGGTFRQGTPGIPPERQFPPGVGMPPYGERQGQGFPPSGQYPTGPGGCQGPEECKKYCMEHTEECKNFMPPQSQFTTYPKPSPISQPATSPFACPNEFNPVCGTDGHTYSNPCLAKFVGVPIARQGDCNQSGALQPPPPGTTFTCTEEFLPVCGADNQTYQNRCLAEAKGVRIAYQGKCQPVTSPDAVTGCQGYNEPVCGYDNHTYPNECEAKKYNVLIAYIGECKTAAPSPYPYQEPTSDTTCPTSNEPVCGADGKTYQNGCYAKMAGAGVAYPGECRTQTSTTYGGNLLSAFGQYLKRVFYGLTL